MSGPQTISNPVDYALQSSKAQSTRMNTATMNVSRSTQDGALRQFHDLESTLTGTVASQAKVYLNPVTVKKLQSVNGLHAYNKTMETTYKQFMNEFGTKENIRSIDHRCQLICNEILKLNNDTSAFQKGATVKEIQKQLDSFRDIQSTITHIRNDINESKDLLVNQDIPRLLKTLADHNVRDKDANDIEAINKAQFNLAQKVGPVVFDEGTGMNAGYFTVKVGNVKLLEGNYINTPTYMSTPNAVPGVDLQPAYVPNNAAAGVIVSFDDAISGGELGGLNQANAELQTIQSALDQFAYQLKDQLNELHNLGTGTRAPPSLTGSVGLKGAEGIPLTGAEIISGQGTLRIGLVDPTQNGVLVDYVDVVLQDNESITDLVNRINAQGYAHNSGNTFTVSVTANGAIDVRCNGGNPNTNLGISIGSVGEDPAMLSTGNVYDAPTGANFSHFFHLNDLITTSMGVNQNTFGHGLFSQLNVRADLFDFDRLSGCRLNYDANPAVDDYGVVAKPPEARNIFHQLYHSFSFRRDFQAVGDIPQSTMTLLDYGARFTEVYNRKTIDMIENVKTSDILLQDTRLTFQTESGINTEDERLHLVDLANSRKALLAVITANQKMENIIQQTLLDLRVT